MNEQEESPKAKSPKTFWHIWFEEMFRVSLIPLGLKVCTDSPVTAAPPEADVVIIRENTPKWTAGQRKFLPDGIRDTRAPHILIELKYSESANEDAICQTAGYYRFYRKHAKLKEEDIRVFLISSMTPDKETLKFLGYEPSDHPGIYRSSQSVNRLIDLIVLNELPNEDHNALFRLFSSRKKEMLSALEKVKQMLPRLPEAIRSFLAIFIKNVLEKGEKEMDWLKLTPQEKEAMRDGLLEMLRSDFPPEKVMSKYKTEERLAGIPPEERLAGIPPEERLAGIPSEEVMTRYKPEERLAGLSPEEIEDYLRKLKGLTEH